MAATDPLLVFVRDALGRGVPRAQIEDALRKSGWTTDQILGALTAYADIDFPIPVPRARPYLSAREAFMYLVLFGTLYASAYNLGSLVFDFINLAFPDASQTFPGYEQYARQSIRWSISGVIVTFPVFLYLSWLTERDLRRDPTKRTSKVRRWLTYLTLFSAACALLGDFTTLVYNVLGGELTVRFLLKVATVALISGTVFIHYLREIRQEEVESREVTGKRALAIVLVIVVAAVVTRGIVIIGSPSEERTRRLDARRVEDLQRISGAVEVYHQRHQRVPVSLDELSKEPGLSAIARDPVTEQPYAYRSFNANSYELCGTFERDTADASSVDFWSHGAGTQCFTVNVKPKTP